MQSTTSRLDSGRPSLRELVREIQSFLRDKFSIQVGSLDMDLLATGVLDSAAHVNLLRHIEQHFRLRLPMERLEIGSIRSVASIAELIANYSRPQADLPPQADTSEIGERTNLVREIRALFQEMSSVHIEADTNLFETGALDSMTLVQFILNLEEKFAFHLPMEDIDMESFRSVAKIAELVANRTGKSRTPKTAE